MPDFVSCPKCGCRIQMLLASANQRVRCASCGNRFEPGEPALPPPVELLPPWKRTPVEDLPPLDALPVDDPPPRQRPPEPNRTDGERRPPRLLDVPLDLRRTFFDEDQDDLPFCPGCGRRVRWEAYHCPHCDEEFEDDSDLRRQRRRSANSSMRRPKEPHRGTLISRLGAASLALGILALCGGVAALVALPLGLTAWVLATGDLEQMSNGIVDSRGRKLTETGRGNAITGVAFSAVFGGTWLFMWFWIG